MSKLWTLLTLVHVFLFYGCAEVPKQAVELSATLGRDLAEVHRAHRELAVRYFDRIRADINAFVDEVYRPYTIEKAIQDFELIEKIKSATEPNAPFDPLTVMDVFVAEVSREIGSFRQELLRPIEQQERVVLTAIDDSYQTLQNANAIVTGHLASIRKVREAQAELLERTKLEGLRQKFIDTTVALSERIGKLVRKGREAEGQLEKVEEAVKELKAIVSGKETEGTQ